MKKILLLVLLSSFMTFEGFTQKNEKKLKSEPSEKSKEHELKKGESRVKVLRYDSSQKAFKNEDGFVWEDSLPNLKVWTGKNLDMDLNGIFNNLNLDFNKSAQSQFLNVNVYTNKPETNVLNVKFTTLKTGDVKISVLNLDGEVVAKEVVKDFSGDYLGQMDLGEGKSGVFFVIISQGEDGITRKVKVG